VASNTIDIKKLIDSMPFNRAQVGIMLLSALVALLDGFDAQAISFVASAMARDLNVNVNTFGPIFGAGTLGMALGALGLPLLCDRWGRRRLIIASVVMFGIFSLATVWVESFTMLFVLRLLTGLGVGAAVPCMVPLIAEYSPSRIAGMVITTVTCSWPLGAVLGGAVSAKIIPIWGWHSVFVLGGILPLLLALVLLRYLPESVTFLATRGDDPKRISTLLLKIFPNAKVTAEDRFVTSEKILSGSPVKHLLSNGRRTMTLLLWTSFFMNFLVLFFIFNWLPPLLQQGNVPMQTAVFAAVTFNLGGIVGCVALGFLMAKFGQTIIVTLAYAVGTISVAAIGMFGGGIAPLLLAVFVAGFCLVGAQACGNALVAALYPTSIRSTALGWAYGIGRIGSIVGPVVAGILLTLGWSMSGLFWIAALPLLCASLAMLSLHLVLTKATALGYPETVTP
jgi:AAHS family 4-hydroxybenzoate transporter-like MFS transporter